MRWQLSGEVNIGLPDLFDNWNNYSEYFKEKSHIISWPLKTKIANNCFNVIGNKSFSSVIFSCFWISFYDSTARVIIEYFPYLFSYRLRRFIRLLCLEFGGL